MFLFYLFGSFWGYYTSSTGVSVSVGSPKTIGASWLKKQAKCWSYGGYIWWFHPFSIGIFHEQTIQILVVSTICLFSKPGWWSQLVYFMENPICKRMISGYPLRSNQLSWGRRDFQLSFAEASHCSPETMNDSFFRKSIVSGEWNATIDADISQGQHNVSLEKSDLRRLGITKLDIAWPSTLSSASHYPEVDVLIESGMRSKSLSEKLGYHFVKTEMRCCITKHIYM